MSFVYANPSSGPSAGGIGWFNYGNLTLNPGQSLTGLTGILTDGSTVTFDLALNVISGTGRPFTAVQPPAFPGANFGTTGYTMIPGNVVLNGASIIPAGISAFTISNIVVLDSIGNPVPNYTAVVADAERTNLGESWNWVTNGGGWKQLAMLGPNPPTLTGLGTPIADIIGTVVGDSSAYVLTTQNPTQLVLTVVDDPQSVQGFALGFAVTKIRLQKNITERIYPSDQFTLNITGTPNDSATTAGASTGLQSQFADVWAIPANAYGINEAMAPGSISLLSDYTRVVTAANSTPGGSIPPIGALPITFAPALGDDVVYTIINAGMQTFHKRVDKAYADVGEVLTYTVTINNLENFSISNVLMTDSTPAGTTYVGNLAVSAPYTGTSPATGITVTSIAANSFVTISWQVQVDTAPPIIDPIENFASVVIPGGNSGDTNTVTTQVRHANLQSSGNFVKGVDLAYAAYGDTLTYTLNLQNTGNVSANTVVVTDSIPGGTTYVPGSVSSSVPFTGDPTTAITLTSPIPASGTATITFQVKLLNGAPPVNPVPNTANVSYSYIVDPVLAPVSATAVSNTVTTQVSTAKLIVTKTTSQEVAYLDDVFTYSFSITNTGNVAAALTLFTDILPNGLTLQPGSLTVSVPYTLIPPNSILLTNAIAPNEIVTISFQVKVTSMPILNPMVNQGSVTFRYTVNPNNPNGVEGNYVSNAVRTTVFRYNFSQQITDLIQSVALEEAALAAIINAEGAKIQTMAAMGDITHQQLLCLNKSVTDMTETLAMLESVQKQKLNVVRCQINGSCR